MPSHVKERLLKEVTRYRGIRVERTHLGAELCFRLVPGSWLTIAKRLTACGHTATATYLGSGIYLSTSASLEEVMTFLRGRKVRRSVSRKWLFLPGVAVVPMLLLMNLSVKPEATLMREPATEAILCNVDKIKGWLEAEASNPALILIHEVQVGGVKAGTLTCNSIAYSYSIELSEPRRVLKLEKLDS